MIKEVTSAVVVAAVAGCVTAPERQPPPSLVTIEYDVIDQPDRERLELRYKNKTDGTVCIMSGAWPNSIGKLNQMGARVYVQVEGHRFPVENFNVGFGTDDGLLRVSPGSEIVGYLAYADFDLPSEFLRAPKSLELKPPAQRCQ